MTVATGDLTVRHEVRSYGMLDVIVNGPKQSYNRASHKAAAYARNHVRTPGVSDIGTHLTRIYSGATFMDDGRFEYRVTYAVSEDDQDDVHTD
jgi:hypothetical protein